jgi:hypothetical protein
MNRRVPAQQQLIKTTFGKGSIMKTTWTTLCVALAASLLAVETLAAGPTRKPYSTGSVGNANFSTGHAFHQGNLSSSTLKSSGQILVMHNDSNSSTKLGTLNTAKKFNTAAAKNVGQFESREV